MNPTQLSAMKTGRWTAPPRISDDKMTIPLLPQSAVSKLLQLIRIKSIFVANDYQLLDRAKLRWDFRILALLEGIASRRIA
jgi:hypothetical protein